MIGKSYQNHFFNLFCHWGRPSLQPNTPSTMTHLTLYTPVLPEPKESFLTNSKTCGPGCPCHHDMPPKGYPWRLSVQRAGHTDVHRLKPAYAIPGLLAPVYFRHSGSFLDWDAFFFASILDGLRPLASRSLTFNLCCDLIIRLTFIPVCRI